MEKVFTYNELKVLKNLNKLFLFKDITQEQLKQLYFNEYISPQNIADLYGVSKYQVNKKMKEYNLSYMDLKVNSFLKSDCMSQINEMSKERLLRETISDISIALTHFIFRNGPIEDMHANGQLSQDDMMILNKYMVNRIAGLLTFMQEGKWAWIENLLGYYKMYGTHWDEPVPDVEEFDVMMRHNLKKMNNK